MVTLTEEERQRALSKMGTMTGLAIALHNFPEGLATFVATLADTHTGAAIAVAIALHNIPEGICVAMPIYHATGSKWKGFWWAFLSGVSEPIGGLMGYLVRGLPRVCGVLVPAERDHPAGLREDGLQDRRRFKMQSCCCNLGAAFEMAAIHKAPQGLAQVQGGRVKSPTRSHHLPSGSSLSGGDHLQLERPLRRSSRRL